MAFCGNCGVETADDGVCPNCGPVAAQPEEVPEQAFSEPAPQQSEEPPQQQPVQQNLNNMKGQGSNMERPSWLMNKTATICGIIFLYPAVLFAYRLNKYALQGDVMSGGRFYWRYFGWTILFSIPLVGWIYGFTRLQDIVDTRIQLWDKLNSQ